MKVACFLFRSSADAADCRAIDRKSNLVISLPALVKLNFHEGNVDSWGQMVLLEKRSEVGLRALIVLQSTRGDNLSDVERDIHIIVVCHIFSGISPIWDLIDLETVISFAKDLNLEIFSSIVSSWLGKIYVTGIVVDFC